LYIPNICQSNPMLVHKVHSENKLAIMSIIDIGENTQKKARAETIQILKEFPSFVATSQFLCDVVRRAIKRAQKIMETVSYSLSILLPHFSLQDSPIPSCFVIWPCTINSLPPQAKHQIGKIEHTKMHDVQACTLG